MVSEPAPLVPGLGRLSERRRTIRRGCHLPVSYQSVAGLSDVPRKAVAFNLSTHGIGLHTNHRLQPGEAIAVELPALTGVHDGRVLYAQVIHADRAPVLGGWVLGCALVRGELTEEEIAALAG
jgi:hypothetical protein